MAYIRFPTALITYENILLDVVNGNATHKKENGDIVPVVECIANLGDIEKKEIAGKLGSGDPDELTKFLNGHDSQIQPGFEAELEMVLDYSSNRSQGLVIINPYPGPQPKLRNTKKDEKNEFKLNIIENLINKDPQKRPFVSVHTQKEDFRQIVAGNLYHDKGRFIINTAAFMKEISDEATGGAFELKERAIDENKAIENNLKNDIPYEKRKYLILLGQRGSGLTPSFELAIKSNFAEAISLPLKRANDQFKREINDPNGTYAKITGDIKYIIFIIFFGIFMLNVFSGVTTQYINSFFGIKSTKALGQGSLKRLKQSTSKKKKKRKSLKKRIRKRNYIFS